MNYKRRKPRTKVRCYLCTDDRLGNSLKDARKQDRLRAETNAELKGATHMDIVFSHTQHLLAEELYYY